VLLPGTLPGTCYLVDDPKTDAHFGSSPQEFGH